MTVFFVTTGTSIRTMPNFRNLLDELPEARERFQTHVPEDGWRDTPTTDDEARLIAESLAGDDELRDLLRQRLRTTDDLAPLSADLRSLWAGGPPAPGPGDEVVLICSDNRFGTQSAITVAYLLGWRFLTGSASAERPVASTLTSPMPGLAGGDEAGPRAIAMRVTHLNTKATAHFAEAASGLGKLMGWCFDRATGSELVIHATGGYKATIPFIVAIASHLPLNGPNVTGWITHVQSDAAIQVPILRSGLKNGDLEVTIVAVANGALPASSTWEDYAYRRGPMGFELTELGQALNHMRT